MSWRSVRVRLTALVVAVSAGAMVLAATFGVSLIRDSLVDDVLDETAEQSVLFDGIIFEQGAGEAVFVDPFEFGFFEDELDSFASGLQDLALELDRIGALDELLDRTGRTRADGLAMFTGIGLVAIVGLDGADTTFLDVEPSEFGAPLAWEFNLQDVVFTGIDFELNGIFDQADASGVLDEALFDDLLEQRLITQAAAMDISMTSVELDGIEFVIVADVADIGRSVDKIRSILWLTMPILIALAAIATWIMTGRALSPVRRMSRQVAVISGGTLHERVPVPTTGDEIEELGTTMNAMLNRLETDDKRLRQFISDASHELRSPVAVLRSEAEVALHSPEAADAIELAEGVLEESLRLERIVADLLVLARGDEAGAVRSSAVVDLDDIVLAEARRRRRVPVDTRSVSAGRVDGTFDGCTRILVHLLDNAARYAESKVGVGLRMDQTTVTLWVDDDGPGIRAEDRDRVFERFTRLEEARTRDTGGAGLGLAVVAATVLAMQGTIVVEDSPLGGARFVVRWPLVV